MAKKCNKCSEWKEVVEFGFDKRNSDGRQGDCNQCKQAANKALREKRIAANDYVAVSEKTCSKCAAVKKPEEFFKDRAMPDGYSTICKDCKKAKTYAWRAANKAQYNESQKAYSKAHPEMRYGVEIKRRYGCTLEQYNAMLVAQGAKCAICPTLHNPAEKKGRLYVDHDHTTGKVRALLCKHCNSMIGYAKDDVATLAAAIEYIAKHKLDK